MFAGNVGVAQSLDTIMQTAVQTKDVANLRWHIVGDGVAIEDVKKFIEENNLKNVIVHGRQPLEKMADFYKMADAMIVTLKKDDGLSMTVPGKIQTCLSAGKPIIAAIDGAGAEVINSAQCGYCAPAEDVNAMADNVRKFCANSDKEKFSINARSFYEKNFDKSKFFEKLETYLKENC